MLAKHTKDVLLPFYDNILSFYKDIIKKSSEYNYIVFVTQRSANLAGIFAKIISKGKGSPLPQNFISGSALLAMVPDIARRYIMYGWCPTILIVEDILVYGESINAFLTELETQLYINLQSESAISFSEELKLSPLFEGLSSNRASKKDIGSALRRTVRIHAFARNNQPTLLSSSYQSGFTVANAMEPAKWRDLCRRTCHLSLSIGQVNPGFMVGTNIKKDEGNWDALLQAGFSQVDTTYDTFPQKLFCRTITLAGSQNIICAIRVLPSCLTGDWVAVPFVLLPDLTEQQLDTLTKAILRPLKTQLGCTPLGVGGYWQDCPQIKAEAIMMLLGVGLLQEFCGRLGVVPEYVGTENLKMNFGAELKDSVKTFIDSILSPDVYLPVNRILADCFGVEAPNNVGRKLDNGGDALIELIENVVYETSMAYWADDYWSTQMYQEKKPSSKLETSDHFFPISTLLNQIAGSCVGRYSLSQLLAWVLQLVDGGYLGLAVKSFETEKGKYLVQCVKTT